MVECATTSSPRYEKQLTASLLHRKTKDPNADGTAVNETLFEKVEKLRRFNPALKRRVSPYIVEGMRDEEKSDLGSSVPPTEELADDHSNDSQEDELEILQKNSHMAGIAAVGLLFLLLAVIAVVVWWTISRNAESIQAPPTVEITPPPIFVPDDLGPMFILRIVLRGLTKELFEPVEVKQAYVETIQKMPPLTRLQKCLYDTANE